MMRLVETTMRVRSVGWAKRSVPTITSRMLEGGHGADAPLPTLRSLPAVVANAWSAKASALEHAAEHLFEDLAHDVLAGELAVVPPPAVLLHLGRGGDEAARDLVEVGIGVVEAEDQPARADPAQREALGAQVILQHPVVARGRGVTD